MAQVFILAKVKHGEPPLFARRLTSLLGHPHREMSHEDVRHLSQLMAAELVVEPTHGKNMLESQNGFIFLQIGVKIPKMFESTTDLLLDRPFPCGTYHHFCVPKMAITPEKRR